MRSAARSAPARRGGAKHVRDDRVSRKPKDAADQKPGRTSEAPDAPRHRARRRSGLSRRHAPASPRARRSLLALDQAAARRSAPATAADSRRRSCGEAMRPEQRLRLVDTSQLTVDRVLRRGEEPPLEPIGAMGELRDRAVQRLWRQRAVRIAHRLCRASDLRPQCSEGTHRHIRCRGTSRSRTSARVSRMLSTLCPSRSSSAGHRVARHAHWCAAARAAPPRSARSRPH